MAEYNRNCGLRLRAIRCRCGSPCGEFDHRFFGATNVEDRSDDECGFRLVYPVAFFTFVVVPAAA